MRLGGWLFKYRTSLPLPIAAALLLFHGQLVPLWTVWAGVLVTCAGEYVRLQSVRHIGTISRTRTDRLGPLVSTGPFGYVRNPLYLGNIALWVGFALTARLVWLAPIIALLLFAEYHAIVAWEEGLLAARLGDAYADYRARVPRWLPKRASHPLAAASSPQPDAADPSATFSWRETLFSERGTLVAILAGYGLLYVKTAYF